VTRRVLAIARCEWIHNRRDPRSLFVIVALPGLLLLLYGYGINYDLDHIPFAVYDLDGGESARDIIQQFHQNRYFDLIEVIHDRRRIDWLLDRGKVVFVLVFPPDLGRTLRSGREASIQVVLDGTDVTRANVAVGYVEGALMDQSTQLAAEFLRRQGVQVGRTLSLHPTILYNAGLKSQQFIVPGLIAVLLSILAGLLTSTCVVREREWGSFEALVTSPAAAPDILLGKMIPYTIMALVDILLAIALGALVFHVVPAGSLILLLAVSLLYLVASLALGIFFSVVAPTQRVAILLATLAALLPSVLLSGFAFPVASMPSALRVISALVPATHFLTVIRGIYLKAAGADVLWPSIAALAIYAVLLVALAAKGFRKRL